MINSKIKRQRGFTLVEIMMVILVIGMITTMAAPQWLKARETARRSQCMSNLMNMDTAKEQWAMENKKTTGDPCAFSDLVGPTLYLKNTPVCPSGGTYDLKPVSSVATCSHSTHALP